MVKNNQWSELENPGGKIIILTRSPNQIFVYDTEEEASSDDENKDCFVVFNGIMKNGHKFLSVFSRGAHE